MGRNYENHHKTCTERKYQHSVKAFDNAGQSYKVSGKSFFQLIESLNVGYCNCLVVKRGLENQEQNCYGYEDHKYDESVFEEEGSHVDPLAEGSRELTVLLLVEHGPVASDRLKSSDFVEEKVAFVVECIGQADYLKVGYELSAYNFMGQAQEE